MCLCIESGLAAWKYLVRPNARKTQLLSNVADRSHSHEASIAVNRQDAAGNFPVSRRQKTWGAVTCWAEQCDVVVAFLGRNNI